MVPDIGGVVSTIAGALFAVPGVNGVELAVTDVALKIFLVFGSGLTKCSLLAGFPLTLRSFSMLSSHLFHMLRS